MPEQEARSERLVTTNRKARHNYTILSSYEAGIVLTGTEVKSLRQGNANIAESHAIIKNGEVWLLGMHIKPYEQGSYANVDPDRSRKLLLHKKEIRKLSGKSEQRGLTLVPLRVYFKNNRAKVELAVGQGKREYDKRQDIAKREAERALRRKFAR